MYHSESATKHRKTNRLRFGMWTSQAGNVNKLNLHEAGITSASQ